MAGGWDEIYTAVNPRVWDPLLPVNVELLLQVLLVLVIDELHDGLPAMQKDTHAHTRTGEMGLRQGL